MTGTDRRQARRRARREGDAIAAVDPTRAATRRRNGQARQEPEVGLTFEVRRTTTTRPCTVRPGHRPVAATRVGAARPRPWRTPTATSGTDSARVGPPCSPNRAHGADNLCTPTNCRTSTASCPWRSAAGPPPHGLALVDYAVGGPAVSTVVAVEDHYGRGAEAVAVATSGDSGDARARVAVWGRFYDSRVDAFTAARQIGVERPGARLVIGASLEGDQDDPGGDVDGVGGVGSTSTTWTALPLVRELVAGGRLVHDGGTELAAQVESARVVESAAGGLILSTRLGRTDLLRAAAWATAEQVTATDSLPFFVYQLGITTGSASRLPLRPLMPMYRCRKSSTSPTPVIHRWSWTRVW